MDVMANTDVCHLENFQQDTTRILYDACWPPSQSLSLDCHSFANPRLSQGSYVNWDYLEYRRTWAGATPAGDYIVLECLQINIIDERTNTKYGYNPWHCYWQHVHLHRHLCRCLRKQHYYFHYCHYIKWQGSSVSFVNV